MVAVGCGVAVGSGVAERVGAAVGNVRPGVATGVGEASTLAAGTWIVAGRSGVGGCVVVGGGVSSVAQAKNRTAVKVSKANRYFRAASARMVLTMCPELIPR